MANFLVMPFQFTPMTAKIEWGPANRLADREFLEWLWSISLGRHIPRITGTTNTLDTSFPVNFLPLFGAVSMAICVKMLEVMPMPVVDS